MTKRTYRVFENDTKSHTCKAPTNKESSDYMYKKQKELRRKGMTPAEKWMYEKLKQTGERWNCQSIWGWRLYDFWCARLGVAVEVDGAEHNPEREKIRDEYNYATSGIVVLRVKNFSENDALFALEKIKTAGLWKERRITMGIHRDKEHKMSKRVLRERRRQVLGTLRGNNAVGLLFV